MDQIETHMAEIEEQMSERARRLPDLPRLLEVQGVGHLLGICILAEVGDFRRFSTASKLSSYAGLVPATRRSGGKTWTGGIGCGRKRLRTALIQAAQSLVVHEPSNPLAEHHRSLKRRRGAGRALVAVARKLLEILWLMVTRAVPYAQLDNELNY